ASQPSLPVTRPDGFTKRSTNMRLPLSPLASYSWDVQEDLENVQRSDEFATSSPLTSPGFLSWDSRHGLSDNSETLLKSVFEDWDDPPVSNVIIDEDGVQTLLITSESSFYRSQFSTPAFEFSPTRREDSGSSSSVSSASYPVTPADTGNGLEKGKMLFLDPKAFNSLRGNETGIALSASLLYSPAADEMPVPIWTPRSFSFGLGPDVPLDPLESVNHAAGDINNERWDEKMWSPSFLRPLRTAPQ
ncbi:hypothetical protein CPB84DRAFT_1762427, partial [Gymnopilus junonius]